MELAEIQTYLPLIGMTIGFLTAVWTGAKWLYHRWETGLDHRIITRVCDEVHVVQDELGKHDGRIHELERRFDDFWKYLNRSGGPSNEP